MVNTAVSAISKYHVVDKDTGIPIGQHSLVSMAKKAFWQQRPPIPRYHATYNISVVLRHISEKTAFLVAFQTLNESQYNRDIIGSLISRYWRSLLPKSFF